MNNQTKGILSVTFTALLWGILAIAIKIAFQFIDTTTMVWFRFAFASVFLLIYFVITKPRELLIVKKFPIKLLFAGLCLGLNYIGFANGLDFTSPSTAQVVIQLGPISLALVGILIFKEQFNKKQLVGFILAFVGLVLFYFNQLKVFASPDTYNKGFLWIIFAAFCWVIYAVFQKRLVEKHHPQLLNLFIYLIPALLFTPATDFSVFQKLDVSQWLLMIFLGANTLLAYGFLAIAFKHTQAYKVSIIITLNPIITIATMQLLYHFSFDFIQGEKLSYLSATGAIMLIGGAVIAIFFSSKNKKK